MTDVLPMQIPAGFGLWTLTLASIYGPKEFSFNLGYSGTWSVSDNHAQSIWLDISGTGCPFAPAAWTDRYTVIKAHANFQDDDTLHEMEWPINQHGTGAWESCPTNTAVLVQKRTGVAGRNQRGRMYIPPTVVSEANVDTVGVIASTPLGVMQTAWDAFWTALVADDFPPQLLHGGTKANPTHAPAPTPIIQFLVEPMVATQRRRLR